MRILTTALIMAISLLTTPALAESFFCPTPQILPATLSLGLTPENQQLKVRQVQNYLTNLKAINRAFLAAPRKPKRDQLTNCLMDHLATLPDNNSLQQPHTRADGATWFLIHAEVQNSLTTQRAFLRNKPHLPYILRWLNTQPQFTSNSPYSVATR